MGEIVVVYELDKAVATRVPRGEERPVRRLHAAPTAPGTSATAGPRTLCGKDTFAMQATGWKPSEHPDTQYHEAYASVVCPGCDAVMET
jgi:hypothetical protein